MHIMLMKLTFANSPTQAW
jgi:hypothetical protein